MATRKRLRELVAMAALAGIALANPSMAAGSTVNSTAALASAPYCGIYWGSLPKTGSAPGVPDWFTVPADGSAVDNVRAGQHDCYDRLVIDVLGSRPGYRVQYVDAIAEYGVNGRGPTVPLLGGAFLEILVPTNAGDANGNLSYTPAHRDQLVDVAGWRTFRQVVEVGYYETGRQFGLGVRGRLPFRVFTLDGPHDHSRLVIDVAHRW
jgi:hypothetical protein